MSRLSNQFGRLLDEWSPFDGFGSLTGDGFTPLADVEETDDAFVIEAELPGLSREDINVDLTGRRLTISGERKERERTGVLRTQTRVSGHFRYEVTLPSDVAADGIEASLDSGVLSVRVPKSPGQQPRHIEVK